MKAYGTNEVLKSEPFFDSNSPDFNYKTVIPLAQDSIKKMVSPFGMALVANF
jgi:hypothetical protein